MKDIIQEARNIAHILLNIVEKPITENKINDAISRVLPMMEGNVGKFDKDDLFEILKSDFSVGRGNITELSKNILPWLDERRSELNFELWNRYKIELTKNDPSFPINELDDYTNKILDKCYNPIEPNSWDRRGMVVGHVQSGKTSNFVGLINKAVDAGYKLVIVIAGTIGSLRRQTQERIDTGFIGRSSSAFIQEKDQKRVVGVGKIPVRTVILPFTSSYYRKTDEGDFNLKTAKTLNFPLGQSPVVLVIKKNKTILENLIEWLAKDENFKEVSEKRRLMDIPTLIIDDEADAASINASKDIKEIKTINGLIRVLLNMINQTTYIGYTATPYANLFISQIYDKDATKLVKGSEYEVGEDLFPRDFIMNLKSPSNYIGATKFFGLEDPITGENYNPLPLFRNLNPVEYSEFFPSVINGKTDLPTDIPKSLYKAILSFVITCAIRRIRGHEKKNNSMLIHVALLVKWIDRVALLVNDNLRIIKDKIGSNHSGILEELKQIFEEDYKETTINVIKNLGYTDSKIKLCTWEQVKKELNKAVSKINVRSVHGTKSISKLEFHGIEEIDYNDPNGLSVIAVGGSRLSRGITLEGLSISYYLRTTKMYDSLLQMGRWFGYRPGYVDLCRIFTNNEIYDWFNHITVATEEMRNDFDLMSSLNKKPEDFLLKVRNHSGLLTITSILKMNFADQIDISFSGKNFQTYSLLKADHAIENNFNALRKLVYDLGIPSKDNRIKVKNNEKKIKYLKYSNVNIDNLCDFIDAFESNQPNIKRSTLTAYIKKQAVEKKIKEWTISIVNNNDNEVILWNDSKTKKVKSGPPTNYELIDKEETLIMQCSVRNVDSEKFNDNDYWIPKNQIDDIKDRQMDLGSDYSNNKDIKKLRGEERKGLLLIYALDPRGDKSINSNLPVIGYSLHFPEIENEDRVSYTVTLNDKLLVDNMLDDDVEVYENIEGVL